MGFVQLSGYTVVFPPSPPIMVAASTKGKFLAGMRKLIKKKKVVNVTTANLKQQVLKQGTGKLCHFVFNTAQAMDSITSSSPVWAVRCLTAPVTWTQTFDTTADTMDRQLPRIQLKSLQFDFTFQMETPGCSRSCYVWIVSMKKDLHAYVGGTNFTAASMVVNQAFISAGQNIVLNPEFFDIKKSWTFMLGDNTAKAGSPALGSITNALGTRTYHGSHKFKTDWTYSDTLQGWTALGENDLSDSRRWYMVACNVTIYGPDTSQISLYQQTLAKLCY